MDVRLIADPSCSRRVWKKFHPFAKHSNMIHNIKGTVKLCSPLVCKCDLCFVFWVNSKQDYIFFRAGQNQLHCFSFNAFDSDSKGKGGGERMECSIGLWSDMTISYFFNRLFEVVVSRSIFFVFSLLCFSKVEFKCWDQVHTRRGHKATLGVCMCVCATQKCTVANDFDQPM